MIVEKMDTGKIATITLTVNEICDINNALYFMITKDEKIPDKVKQLKAKFGLTYEMVKYGMISGFAVDCAQENGLTDSRING